MSRVKRVTRTKKPARKARTRTAKVPRVDRIEQYREALKETEALLKKGLYYSAAEISRELAVSRQTAYSRIEALREFCTIEEKYDRVGSRGPVTLVYRIKSGSVPDGARA